MDDDVTRPAGRWQEQLTVGQSVVNIKLDTGAQANVISLATLTVAMPEHTIMPTNVILTAFGDGKIQQLGTIVIPCRHKGQDWRIKFYATEKTNVPVTGQNACEKLGLIKRIDSLQAPLTKERLLEQYTDVFTGTGQYKQEYEI